MSEIIFGSIVYEISMYLYEHKMSKSDLKKNLNIKISTLLKGYIIGGQ